MLLGIYFFNREELLKLIEKIGILDILWKSTRIQRVMEEKGAEFDPIRHEVEKIIFPSLRIYLYGKKACRLARRRSSDGKSGLA